MGAGGRHISLLAIVLATAGGCGSDPEKNVLQPADLERVETSFDQNLLIDAADFEASERLDAEGVQTFLTKTPYQRASFLDTYQSNGVRAADAVVASARKYKLSPVVFLAYAQVTQGLVGEASYPSPPDRVEYVFRCGCLDTKACLPEFAGFDRQIDCLGLALRTALDQIKASKTTTSGWGVDVEATTLDAVVVKPSNDATAAIYSRTPRVNEGKGGGAWIVWNVLNLYAKNAGTAPAVGSSSTRSPSPR